MNRRTVEISNLTGGEFLKKLTRMIEDEKNWKGGKNIEFEYKIDEITIPFFTIKAMKKLNPIEEIMKFYKGNNHELFSWDDAKDYLENRKFLDYYNGFQTMKLSKLVEEKNKEFLQICLMLTFEIARCKISTKKEMQEAICIALISDESEDLNDLCKMFPKKEETAIERDRRKEAMKKILRRKKMKQVQQINKVWPFGVSSDLVLDILSEDQNFRNSAFKSFMERKKKYKDTLLKQDPQVLEFFKTILRTDNVKHAERAFKEINKRIKKNSDENFA